MYVFIEIHLNKSVTYGEYQNRITYIIMVVLFPCVKLLTNEKKFEIFRTSVNPLLKVEN